MRLSLAVTAFAAGAVASVAPSQEEEITVTVTDYATYCPSSTMSQLPQYTTSAGQTYSITRPMLTTTVTHCNECSSTVAPASTSSPVIPVSSPVRTPLSPSPSPSPPSSSASPSSSSIVIVPTPVVPRPSSTNPVVGPSGSASASGSLSASASSTTPASPLFTGGASRAAAGAGLGLSGVLGLALLL